MATLKITVEPQKNASKVFTAGQLKLAIQGAQIETPLVDDKDELIQALWDLVCEKVRNSAAPKGENPVGKLKNRLSAARVKSKTAGGTIAAGNHQLEVTVLGVKASGPSPSSSKGAPKPKSAPSSSSASNSQQDDDDDEDSGTTETDKCTIRVKVGESTDAQDSEDTEN